MLTLFATRLGSVMPMTLGILLLTAAGHAQIPCGYEVTAIIVGPWCGTQLAPILPYGINEAGDVAGYFICPVLADHAFLWTASLGLQTIPMPPGTTQSRALGIDGTQIVGYHSLSGDEFGRLAFLYDAETGEFTNLGTLPGGTFSEGLAIQQGIVVGNWGNNVVGPIHGFIWQDAVMTDLGPILGTPNSQARDVSPVGKVTGWMGESLIFDGNAYIWDNGNVTVLPPIPRGFNSIGQALNQYAHVTGEGLVVLDDGQTIVVRSFLRDGKQMSDIGTLPGTTFTRARDIDEQDRIVGASHNAGLIDLTAFVWAAGEMAALNDLIPPEFNLNIDSARAINQAGQIAALAYSDDLNATVGVVLTPVEGPLGDLNGDCVVGILDLLALLADWGPCPPMADCPGDLNNDETVNVFDLLLLLMNWG